MLKHIETGLLDIAYDEQGDASGWPVVLLHGFPYDIHAYAQVAPPVGSARSARHRAVSARLWGNALSVD
ncbi:MAG: Epoxide hydrolase (EC [uncultured Paraburkholderia sp.]|nr:MAG: Epoxide hydrolase (EC [uncultured Paraburkholderia sp.]CAH2941397.1 MAG: Epoxide hydrolase (EC [uncultured Paraburkholderia sp.]